MNGFMRIYGIMVIVGLTCLLLAACGGAGGSNNTAPAAPLAPAPVNQSADIAEILAAPAPDGVDAALWETLTTELAKEVGQKTAAQEDNEWFDWVPWSDAIAWNNDFMRADGSDNGVVDIADLSPIAINYGNETGQGEAYSYADYNRDRIVNVSDIVVLARKFGLSCSGFRVELSDTSAESGFSVVDTVDYADYSGHWAGLRVYTYPCETARLAPRWVRIFVLDGAGQDLGYQVWRVPGAGFSAPYGERLIISLVEREPPTIGWDTSNWMPDGNQDGTVNWFDLGFLVEFGGTWTSEQPLLKPADYDGDGRIWVGDVTPVAVRYGEGVKYFTIEVSTVSAEEGFLADGTVDYFDSVGFNEFGFRYYEYEIAAPPESGAYWVRVVPCSIEGERGVPSAAVAFGK